MKHATSSRAASKVRAIDSNLSSLITTIADISAGEELSEFRRVMELFSYPVILTDSQARIIYANPAWERLTGYSLPEVVGANPRILGSRSTPTFIFRNMWNVLMKGKPYTSESIINTRKDGTEYNVATTIFPLIKNNKLMFYVQVLQDITERKRLEELKTGFLMAATHELRTPITSLKLLIQAGLLRMRRGKNNTMSEHELELMERELNRLLRLINDLTDVSRIESGKLRLDKKRIDLGRLIQDTIEEIQYMTTIPVRVLQIKPDIFVICDSDRIKQVLMNLLTNAIKYTPQGKHIDVTLHHESNHVRVCVRDEGQGIPVDHQARIFNRFYQIDSVKKEGFGLGLYIAREIIQQHNGQLWVKSQTGNGSTFCFRLSKCQ